MPSSSSTPSVPALQPHIARHILLLRSQCVMLDAELAALYGVQTKVLVQSIKRNIERFPADFMFQLDTEEFANLRSQFVTSKPVVAYTLLLEELFGQGPQASRAKRGPAPKWQQQIEAVAKLPRAQQRFVSQMLDTVLAGGVAA
jgi:ORF6N domain